MNFAFDQRDKRPLYVQLADDLAGRIERGDLREGDRLPGMRELAAELHVGLVTVSQAYDSLVARGRAIARVGKGTYVTEMPVPTAPFARRWEPDIGSVSRARMESVLDRLERASVPGAISLATGHPAPETFPLAEFGKCVQRTLADDPPETMQYASGSGDPDLRETLASHLRARGVPAAANDIVVCSGAQQAADIVAATLLENRAVVAAESPSYAPTLGVFDARGATYVEIAADTGGIRVDDVERVFAEYRPRVFYVNPFAQNPTGAVLPDRRAKAIVALARRYDVVILEDQTGWVFTYGGRRARAARRARHGRSRRADRESFEVDLPGLARRIRVRARWLARPARGGEDACRFVHVDALATCAVAFPHVARLSKAFACGAFALPFPARRVRRCADPFVAVGGRRAAGSGHDDVVASSRSLLECGGVRCVRARRRPRHAGGSVVSDAERTRGAPARIRRSRRCGRDGSGRAPLARPRHAGRIDGRRRAGRVADA